MEEKNNIHSKYFGILLLYFGIHGLAHKYICLGHKKSSFSKKKNIFTSGINHLHLNSNIKWLDPVYKPVVLKLHFVSSVILGRRIIGEGKHTIVLHKTFLNIMKTYVYNCDVCLTSKKTTPGVLCVELIFFRRVRRLNTNHFCVRFGHGDLHLLCATVVARGAKFDLHGLLVLLLTLQAVCHRLDRSHPFLPDPGMKHTHPDPPLDYIQPVPFIGLSKTTTEKHCVKIFFFFKLL